MIKKNSIVALLFILAAMVQARPSGDGCGKSGSQKKIRYSIEGSIGRDNFTGTLYLGNSNDFQPYKTIVDSVRVENGRIVPHEAEADSVFCGCLFNLDARIAEQVFVESGKIIATVDAESGDVYFVGTELNDDCSSLYRQLLKLEEAETDKTEILKKTDSLVFPVLKKHADDPLGVSLALDFSGNIGDYSRGIEYFDALSGRWKAKELVQNERLRLETQVHTQVGLKFKDFAVEYEGKTTRLSDYVGRGNYVVADFWASWCGPCRAEIPNLVKAYDKYKDRGLQVVGIAVWDKPKATQRAVSEDANPFPQILNSQKIATDVYGINAIPEIILFAPDGTILARGLHGELLRAKLAEVFGE